MHLIHKVKSALLIGLVMTHAAWAKVPQIVVTIKPIHSLVEGLTSGVTEPTLLLPPGASPHSFNLKPSQRKLISDADLVIWVGPDLENVLIQTMKSLPKDKQLRLLDGHEIKALPYRQPDEHEHEHEHHNHHHTLDPHIWINTDYAKLIIKQVLTKLITLDAEHQAQYHKNADRLYQKLDTLKQDIQNTIGAHKNVPYLVYHDAYQYFETEFGLQPATVINANPHAPMSAKKIIELQKMIQAKKIACVCTEPEFGDKVLNALDADNMKHVVLDALGVYQGTGEDAYFDTMRVLSQQLSSCLEWVPQPVTNP